MITTEIYVFYKQKLAKLYNIAACKREKPVVLYRHKRKAPFQKKDFLPPFFLNGEVRTEVVESNQKIAYSEKFRRNGKAVYRSIEIPTCKSIPQKGTDVRRHWECGMEIRSVKSSICRMRR